MKRLEAWARWQMAAGPWRGWAVCPVLSMPHAVAPASGAATPGTRPLPGMEEALAQGATAVVLDLEPRLGVRIAAEVSARGLAHVVLVLPRWPHAQAVLPSEALLATLRHTADRLNTKAVESSNVVFVLDAERQRSIRRPKNDPRIDNRYAVAPSDLPNLATLRSAGITRLVKVTPSR